MIAVTKKHVERAYDKIKDHILCTPMLYSNIFSDKTGAVVYFKYENKQYTRAFKVRGALHCLMNLTNAQKRRGVVACSAGNHAQGLAYYAKKMDVPAVIVMPADTPFVKVHKTKKYGAEVILHGNFEQSHQYALKLADEKGYTFVHPFDDVDIIAGQGTCGLEMLDCVPDLEALIIPIGGGGLIAGIATYAKGLNPNIKVYGAQTALYPFMKYPDADVCGTTIAEGIAVKQPGEIPKKIVAELVDDIFIMNESQIERALVELIENENSVVEGAAACGVAVLMAHPDVFKGKKVGVLLCGGNIDQRMLASILMRDLVAIGRLGRLSISLPDQPGALAIVSDIIGSNGGNVIEMTYQPIFSATTAKETRIEIAIETDSALQLRHIIDTLHKKGYATHQMENR